MSNLKIADFPRIGEEVNWHHLASIFETKDHFNPSAQNNNLPQLFTLQALEFIISLKEMTLDVDWFLTRIINRAMDFDLTFSTWSDYLDFCKNLRDLGTVTARQSVKEYQSLFDYTWPVLLGIEEALVVIDKADAKIVEFGKTFKLKNEEGNTTHDAIILRDGILGILGIDGQYHAQSPLKQEDASIAWVKSLLPSYYEVVR